MTAKEWREKNPELANKGNIRDYTDLLHLVILNNLENTNAELIENNVSQSERLVRLNDMAKKQMELFSKNKSLKNLEYIENKFNDKKEEAELYNGLGYLYSANEDYEKANELR